MYCMISLWPVWLLNRQKKALLLNYNRKEAYEVCENLTTGAEDETYEDVITLLDGHFALKRKISYECFSQNFKQNSNEKIHQIYTTVNQQILNGDFGDTNSEIKQQLILVTSSKKVRRYCFHNPETTLKNLLRERLDEDADAESQAEEIEKIPKDVEEVNLTRKSRKQNQTEESSKDIGKGKYFRRKSSQTCFRCSGSYPHTAQCPAIQKTCNHCHRKNHFKRCCQNKYRWNTGNGELLNHLTASSSIFKSESDSNNDVFAI